MADTHYTLTVDTPEPGRLALGIIDPAGREIATEIVSYQGHVDNVLLTDVDNFLKRNTIEKSVLATVRLGEGIDKNSSLYRIVTSFAKAIVAASASTQARKNATNARMRITTCSDPREE